MPYHERTLALLGLPVKATSADQIARVVEAEARLALQLPPSVREWYSRPEALALLQDHSNDDSPVPIEELASLNWRSQVLLPIRHENQGVCTWALLLDGSADPPVYVDVDSDGRLWTKHAPAFSEYVFASIWDYARVLRRAALVLAQNRPLSALALAELKRVGVAMPETAGWPGRRQYRFTVNNACALVWDDDGQADWAVGADDASALAEALAVLWELDDVGSALYEGSSDGGEALAVTKQRRARSN